MTAGSQHRRADARGLEAPADDAHGQVEPRTADRNVRHVADSQPADEEVVVADTQAGTALALRLVGTLFALWIARPPSKDSGLYMLPLIGLSSGTGNRSCSAPTVVLDGPVAVHLRRILEAGLVAGLTGRGGEYDQPTAPSIT